jgi:hypothetical protein
MVETTDGYVKLLSFLTKTKNGQYAPIDEESMPYVRLIDVTVVDDVFEHEFYYSTESRIT